MLMRYRTICCRRLLVFSCRYTRFAPQNPGRKLASGRDYVLVGGLFEVHTHTLSFLSPSPSLPLSFSLLPPPSPLESIQRYRHAIRQVGSQPEGLARQPSCANPDWLAPPSRDQGVHVDNTKQPYGLRTHGVDDLGFFNQRVDNVETYLVALAS